MELCDRRSKRRGRSSLSHSGSGTLLPFKVDLGSGTPEFAPLCLRMDDKAAHAGMPDLFLLSLVATKRSADTAAKDSHRQVVGLRK